MKSIRSLAFLTATFAYALIVIGLVVRITDSGMGCGDDWPLCNGQVVPAFTDHHVVIEYLHRVVTLGITGLTLALAAVTLARRNEPGVAGPAGPLRAVALAMGLLGLQVMLGAIVVWLELQALSVVLHLGTALAFLAALLVAGFRAGAPSPGSPDRLVGGARAALVLSGLTILLGGLTATTGAAGSCQGFPLCNGEVWPTTGGGLAHLHWTHRLLAYGLFLHLVGLAFRSRQSGAVVRQATWVAAGLGVLQVVVAAGMVMMALPMAFRVAHAVIGVGVWVALVWLVWQARHAGQPA